MVRALRAALGAVCFLAVVDHASGQAVPAGDLVVTGFVRSETGDPVVHAEVRVLGTGRQTVTGSDGRFRLAGVRGGHELEVTRYGYRPARLQVEFTGRGIAFVEVVLTPTPLTLPGVQVTASPGARAGESLAQPTLQLAGRDLERNLGSSLAQTLAGQPGLDVRYNGPATALPVLRGLTGDRVLVLQDGQRVGDLSGSAEDHSLTVDPLTAQRVEVVRGPASLLYGTNALGGVVHVLSGDAPSLVPPRLQFGAAVQTETATPGASASARALLPVGEEWAVSMRAGARSTADVRIPTDAVLGRTLPNTQHRNGSAAVGVARSGRRVDGGVSVQAHVMAHGVPLPADADEEIELRGRRAAANARLEVRTGAPAVPSLRLQASVSDYTHDEVADGVVEMAFGLRTLVADALLRQASTGAFGDGAWGVSVLERRYAATGEEQLTAPADARTWGVFTFQELWLGRGAALQAGARLDRYAIASRDDAHFGPAVHRTFTTLSGSTGVAAPVAGPVHAALNVARSFRAPTVEELFSDALHIGTASFEVGDATLRPEVATGVDAALRVRAAALNGELSAWTNTIEDFIHFEARGDTVIDGVTWPVLHHVQDRARFAGAEALLAWQVAGPWVLTVRGDMVRGRLRGDRPVPFLPAARVAGAVRRDDGRTDAGAAVRHAFAQGRVAEGETAAAAHTLLDVHAALRLGSGGREHTLTVRAENVLNTSYRTASSRIKDFAPNPGRNVSLLYRVHF